MNDEKVLGYDRQPLIFDRMFYIHGSKNICVKFSQIVDKMNDKKDLSYDDQSIFSVP
jgi:hypothetical protein